MLSAGFNVTGLTEPEEIERQHFLDPLSLLRLPALATAGRIADIGSGGGFPALILALALPGVHVVAIESQRKKCHFIEVAARELSLPNVEVKCVRAEDHGRSQDRESYDVGVSRAVAALPVVAEYTLPLLRVGGRMVAMKGLVSNQERIQAVRALGILGADDVEVFHLEPFEGSVNRWAFVATKVRPTLDDYPRRAGLPAKRPLG